MSDNGLPVIEPSTRAPSVTDYPAPGEDANLTAVDARPQNGHREASSAAAPKATGMARTHDLRDAPGIRRSTLGDPLGIDGGSRTVSAGVRAG